MLKIQFITDNAAFDNHPEYEIVRILDDVTTKIREGVLSSDVFDINGNRVGRFQLTLPEKKPKFPRKKDLVALIKSLKKDIGDEYRSSYADPDDTAPSMDVTIGASGNGHDAWAYQTGDNSFTGGAYGYEYWATTIIDRRSNSSSIADDIIDQLADAYWSDQA